MKKIGKSQSPPRGEPCFDRSTFFGDAAVDDRKLRATAIPHRAIGHKRNFTREQRALLDTYYTANRLRVDCMNAAKTLTNKTRQQIEDTIPLPWDELPQQLGKKDRPQIPGHKNPAPAVRFNLSRT